MALLDDVLDDARLFAAWERVRKNKGSPGVDGQTVDQFGVNVFGRLLTLKHQVERSEYRPQPLREVHIPKPTGAVRRLAVPTVRDRVVQTACAQVLSPHLEGAFEESSFAYRVGRSVPMAVARVAWYRDRGYKWVVDADIQSFFDEVSHTLLTEKLRRTLDDHSLLPLIDLCLAATVQPPDGPPYLLTKGIPQGSPLSPLLANLYLDDLDEAFIEKDLRFVRFSDDFIILCRSRKAAEQALEVTGEVLEALKLGLKETKTRITDFEEGFRFLGVDFIRNLLVPADEEAGRGLLPDADDLAAAEPREHAGAGDETTEPEEDEGPPELPPETVEEVYESLREPVAAQPQEDDEASLALDAELFLLEDNPALEPLLRSLYVTTPGHTLRKEGERLLVADGGQPVASVPLHKLDQVVVQGNQLVSTALLRFARRNRANVTFLDPAGRFEGCFTPRRNRNLQLERRQYQREDDTAFTLMLARAFVGAKVHNQRVVLRRFNRRRQDEAVATQETRMRQATQGLETAPDLQQVRGIEGTAARAYFQALATLLPEQWGFAGRRRQPPTDPFNVLLSYGYGVLFHTLHTLVERRGLNGWLGTLHAADGRHPALVSDLMEEFRALVVDSVALHALLHGFAPSDFVEGSDPYPCRLTEDARKQYLQWLQNKLRSALVHPRTGLRVDYHRLMQYQVWHYARVVLGEELVYHPYRGR